MNSLTGPELKKYYKQCCYIAPSGMNEEEIRFEIAHTLCVGFNNYKTASHMITDLGWVNFAPVLYVISGYVESVVKKNSKMNHFLENLDCLYNLVDTVELLSTTREGAIRQYLENFEDLTGINLERIR